MTAFKKDREEYLKNNSWRSTIDKGRVRFQNFSEPYSRTFNPPVGRRVGRGKMTAGFRNKIDAKKPDSRKNQAFLELLARFELATSSLPRMRSTYWATAAKYMPRNSGHMWRPRRDLNPRPPAWQAGVLTSWTTRPRLGYNTKRHPFCQ